MNVLHIRQDDPVDDLYPILLTLRRDGQPNLEAKAKIEFTFTDREHEDLRWYLEDYLQRANTTETIVVQQIEAMMKSRGEELYTKVLATNQAQRLWFSVSNELADLRIEITSGVAEAASIPWELMRDPETDFPLSLRVNSFVRVQSDPNISFVSVPEIEGGRIRLLYIACRPGGANDVELRAVANRLLQDLGQDRARLDIKALRPPTFEQLRIELIDAKEAGRPYHIVHFDGHGVYADLSKSKLADWIGSLSNLTLGGTTSGKHGYVIFEHSSDDKMRPVDGRMLGQLLHDNGVPVLVLNACQTAMHEAVAAPGIDQSVHDEVRAIGSLAQGVIDEGVPAVLGMRYSVYVTTAAQYIGKLYAALAKGRSFGQAATEGRKDLKDNPDRWLGLKPRPLQDWFVPVVYEAAPLKFFAPDHAPALSATPELDPVQQNRLLLRHVPEEGFVGRDETLFGLDRAFDKHRIVLLHAYAGQGKSSTAVEFARWYATTGGLGKQPRVLLASFERHTDLDDLLNQVGQPFAPVLEDNGIHWSAVNDPDERRRLVLNLLRLFPILWIWDNVEPVAGFPEGTESQWTTDEQRDIRDFLQQIKLDSASQVRILLTSRRDEKAWLGGLPHRIAMPRMRNSDAARLALRLGEDKGITRAEISDWQPLLDYCAGNPLTLVVLISQAVKMRLRGRQSIVDFVEAIRDGEQQVEDVDEVQGRDKSLGASLNYGFRSAFRDDQLPIIALLHLFQGMVNVNTLVLMGTIKDYGLKELRGKTTEALHELLEHSQDTGLLAHLGNRWFTIHPALPWFLRQIFISYYNGQAERSSQEDAIRCWVETIGVVGDYYFNRVVDGNRTVLTILEIEEANLRYAQRLALKKQWWVPVVKCMQALLVLYEYQSRTAEYKRLVDEVRPHYCSSEDEPILGRETGYVLVMEHRIRIAKDFERDLPTAGALQEKQIEFIRKQAAPILLLPLDAPLDSLQRNHLRSLAMALGTLGQILLQSDRPECVDRFHETIAILRRIGDKSGEAISEFNLGLAFLEQDAIRDLDAAEKAYERSLNLQDPDDALSRSRCIKQIAMVNHRRLGDVLARAEGAEIVVPLIQATQEKYLEALELCPKDALVDLAAHHGQLGTFYGVLLAVDKARYHLEQAVHYFEKAGATFDAGKTRFNIALLYLRAAQHEEVTQARSNLERAKAYAEAAFRDFSYYEGRAVKDEENCRRLLTQIREVYESLA